MKKRCKYVNNFIMCSEESYKDHDHCILHLYPGLNMDEDTSEIQKLKNEKFQEKISREDFDFAGIIIGSVDLSEKNIESNVNFRGAIIEEVKFRSTNISGDLDFTDAKILQWANFSDVNIRGSALFNSAKFPNKTFFNNIKVSSNLDFVKSQFKGYLVIEKAKVDGRICFKKARIHDYISAESITVGFLIFDYAKLKYLIFKSSIIRGISLEKISALSIVFDNSTIVSDVHLQFKDLIEGISFHHTKFKLPKTQEKACRYAKNIWESLGEKEEADYYFYREMEGKRLQKPFYIRYPEWIFQKSFGYGVYPLRLFITFFVIFIVFALIYWYIAGLFINDSINNANLLNSIRFSFLTLIIPAYGIVSPNTANYGIFIIIEAILGAFMWPLFIATFARKYMR